MITKKYRFLCVLFILFMALVPSLSSAFSERQYISASYNDETSAVLYLPDLSEHGEVWLCDSWDEDIVIVEVQQIQTGNASSGSRARFVSKITITGVAPGFSYVVPELYIGDKMVWRNVIFVEVDDDLNAIIRYSCLESGNGDTSDVLTDIGESDHFSLEERQSAIDFILNDFQEWNGYTLREVRYGSDQDSAYWLTQYQKYPGETVAVDCICCKITYMTHMVDYYDRGDEPQALREDADYILLLTDNGEWVFYTCGY